MSSAEIRSLQVETLYQDHHGWLRGWLRKKLGCTEQAADLAHDTFLRVLGAQDALAGLKEPRAYLTTMARHLLIDRARRQRIEQSYLAELALMAETLDGAPSPEAILGAVQALDQISLALQGLSPKAGEAFLLHYLHDETQSEIASRLGVSVRMVQKYLAQALLRCRHLLAD